MASHLYTTTHSTLSCPQTFGHFGRQGLAAQQTRESHANRYKMLQRGCPLHLEKSACVYRYCRTSQDLQLTVNSFHAVAPLASLLSPLPGSLCFRGQRVSEAGQFLVFAAKKKGLNQDEEGFVYCVSIVWAGFKNDVSHLWIWFTPVALQQHLAKQCLLLYISTLRLP